MNNLTDLSLATQEIQGYEDPQIVLDCWSSLCCYKMLGFQSEERK